MRYNDALVKDQESFVAKEEQPIEDRHPANLDESNTEVMTLEVRFGLLRKVRQPSSTEESLLGKLQYY